MSTIEMPTSVVADASENLPLASHRSLASSLWARIGITIVLLAASVWLFQYGNEWRQRAWGMTIPMRYESDVACGFGWGQVANRPDVGLTYVYDLYARGRIEGPNALDYTPLRLTMVTLWARWAQQNLHMMSWRNDYELTRPMLRLNTTAECLSAILIFLLIRHWIIRADDAKRNPLLPARPFRGVVRGMIGAAFFWLNPAVIADGHSFPQWDVWNTPFFLGAAMLACCDCWFAAGMCVITGAFFKGQILLVAPMFLVWPIVQLRFDNLLRFIAGFVFAGAMIALPWFNAEPRAIIWFGLSILAMALVTPFVLRWKLSWAIVAPLGLVALILAWPFSTAGASTAMCLLPLFIIAGIALLRFAPPKIIPSFYALAAGVLLLLMIPLFNASSTWFSQGFEFGTKKLMWMATQRTYSLPQLLVSTYHWSNNPNVPVALPMDVPGIGTWVNFRDLMLYIHGACLVLCGVAAAIHSRRNDPKFLVTLVAPWLCWFCLLTQLNNRYLIWAAGLSGLLVGVNWGMVLLGCVVTLIGWLGIDDILHWSGGDPDMSRILSVINQQMIFPLLILAAIYLFVAIAPSPKRVSPAAA
jgi:hypothetical protein